MVDQQIQRCRVRKLRSMPEAAIVNVVGLKRDSMIAAMTAGEKSAS